jgi:archaeal preflagellin peptidase FlaK
VADLTFAAGVIGLEIGVLIIGFGYATFRDLQVREVDDLIWRLMAIIGAVAGAILVLPLGATALILWVLVSAVLLEHLFPWDIALEERSRLPAWIVELIIYGSVGGLLLAIALRGGSAGLSEVAPAGAVYLSVVLARGLFEARVLYGGADAKALMVAGILVPFFPHPILSLPTSATLILSALPFSLTVVVDAALLSIVVPIYLGLRNVARGEFELARGFTGFRIPVAELPKRFVWLRDPTFLSGPAAEEAEVETSEEDRALRQRQAEQLTALGVDRVWVTPQLPFLLFLALGAGAALVAGNLLVDILALL